MTVAVVVIGGEPPGTTVLDELPDHRWVVAADSGLDHALALGIHVDVVVGDMDSVSEAGLAAIDPARRQQHAPDKDATDLELAMTLVLDHGDADRAIIVGGAGGRLDHLLGNATVLCSPRFADLDIEWVSAAGRAFVVRSDVDLHGVPGQIVSLIPIAGDVRGVSTVGLKWRLEDATLPFGTSRGLSNELGAPVGRVSLSSGVLLVVQPDLS